MGWKLRLLLLFWIYLFATEARRTTHKRFSHCSKCPPGWGVEKKCSKIADTKCVKCKPEETYSPIHSSKSSCWLCSKCGVGLYESHKCSIIKDTVCSECTSYLDQKNLTRNIDFLNKCDYLFLN